MHLLNDIREMSGIQKSLNLIMFITGLRNIYMISVRLLSLYLKYLAEPSMFTFPRKTLVIMNTLKMIFFLISHASMIAA